MSSSNAPLECEPTSESPAIISTIILVCNISLLIFVSTWSFVTLRSDEKTQKAKWYKKIWYFVQDLWKRRSLVTPMYVYLTKQKTKIF